MPLFLYLVWSLLFVIAPFLFVIYYAFTDRKGSFSLIIIPDVFRRH